MSWPTVACVRKFLDTHTRARVCVYLEGGEGVHACEQGIGEGCM